MNLIDLEELGGRVGDVTIVDVRRPEEFDGSFGAPCDPRQGHIPGAINLELDELMTLDAQEVSERLGIAPGNEVVAYCHSGSRSALAVRILSDLGYHARNYIGSWHEWSRTELPLEREGLIQGDQ